MDVDAGAKTLANRRKHHDAYAWIGFEPVSYTHLDVYKRQIGAARFNSGAG